MRVLISGGAGYIGSILVEELLTRTDHDVVVFDNLRYRQSSLMAFCADKRFTFHFGDVTQGDEFRREMEQADVIIPLAALVGAPACDADPERAVAVNQTHVEQIARWKRPEQCLLYPNTNSGYGTTEGVSYCDETTPLRPISLYGKTKCAGEQAVLDVGGVSLRLATVFGLSPRMRLDLLVNDFTFKALHDGYIVLFEKDFKRNFIHVRDVAGAFLHLMEHYGDAQGQAYNVGLSDTNLSKWELCLRIKNVIPHFSIQTDEIKKDPDKRNYIVSNAKLEALGWQPRYGLDDGIAELIKGYPMMRQVVVGNYTNL